MRRSNLLLPLFWIGGLIAGFLVGALISTGFNAWYVPRYTSGEEGLGLPSALMFLVFLPIPMLGGVIAGHLLFKRRFGAPR